MNDELTVLDYFKALITPWRGAPPNIWEDPAPPPEEAIPSQDQSPSPTTGDLLTAPSQDTARTLNSDTSPERRPYPGLQAAAGNLRQQVALYRLPWRPMLTLLLALVAQLSLEPAANRTWKTGVIFYFLAAIWLIWSFMRQEWLAIPLPDEDVSASTDHLTFNRPLLLLGVVFSLAAFASFGDNLFTTFNVALWIIALVTMIAAFWQPRPEPDNSKPSWSERLSPRHWHISLSYWTLLLVLVALIAIFFRAYQLNQVPPEMTSDHAEKLLDVQDVLAGQTHIFFPRNTGREAMQFYLTAAASLIFNTGISFLSLKIGTFFAGLVTLIYIYLLGKEVGNREVGLFAAAFAAIAYWPNVITRVALRFSLYPLCVAPTLYYLLRGLRRHNRNDFILAGIWLGLGLQGYTPFRIVPFVILAAFAIYLLHQQSSQQRQRTLGMLAIVAIISFIVFLPLLRYALENPETIAFRAFSRLGDWERPLPGPAPVIFAQNLWRAMLMFGWDNGNVWLVSIPGRPALDVISAALFYLGYLLLLIRYIRRHHWLDLFLLLSVPMLMLPSILSLAFPDENPVLNRTGGALVPVFVIVGLCLASFKNSLEQKAGKILAWGIPLLLFVIAGTQNYDLVFNQYFQQYQQSAWNTSEIDQVLRDFNHLAGTPENAWIFSYPYWIDTRLVGLNDGYPMKDWAISADQLASTQQHPGAKLFILNPLDQSDLSALERVYPRGWLQKYTSKTGSSDKDFNLYFVPPGK